MIGSAYKDKKGRVLFVNKFEGESLLYGTHYHHLKTGALCALVNKSMPRVRDDGEAQANLDAYALTHEYNPWAPAEPKAEPDPAPESNPIPTPSDAGEPPLAETSTGAAEASPAASLPPDEDPERQRRIATLESELRLLVEEEMRVKGQKSSADSKFNAELKDLDERKREILQAVHDEVWPIPGALPFGKAPEAPAEPSTEEPMVVSCEACQGSGKDEASDDCKACMGAGKTVPKAPDAKPELPHDECVCGHVAAAHFDSDGNERACTIKDNDGKACSCSEEGGYESIRLHLSPTTWVSKFAPASPPLKGEHKT